jgi:hypothetical protein
MSKMEVIMIKEKEQALEIPPTPESFDGASTCSLKMERAKNCMKVIKSF